MFHSNAYQSLLQSVKYFNLGVYYLRKMKTESILNQRFEEFPESEFEQFEPFQIYFQKAIKSLNGHIAHHKNFSGEPKKRYYSGDFRVTHKSKPSKSSHQDTNLEESIDLVMGYSYYLLGILMKSSDSYTAKIYFDRSYQLLSNLNDLEMLEFVQRERYEPDYKISSSYESLTNFHIIFNTMFCLSDGFSVFVTKLYDIEMPHFTYYTAMSKTTQFANASRSTSQNVRLYEDSDSSPAAPSNYLYQSPGLDKRNVSQTRIYHHQTSEKLPYKEYRISKQKFYDKRQARPKTSNPNEVNLIN